METLQISNNNSKQSINLKYLVPHREQHAGNSKLYWFALGTISVLIALGVIAKYYYPQELYVIHEVQAGDTLPQIAYLYYENPATWKKIFVANRSQLLENRSGLVIGQKLKIPLTSEQFAKLQNQKNINPPKPDPLNSR